MQSVKLPQQLRLPPPWPSARTFRARTRCRVADVVASAADDDALVEARMRSWLQKVIVGFELCPFARPVLPKTRVFVSHSARDSQQFWDELLVEVRSLDAIALDEPGTTLFVVTHPDWLDWDEYMEGFEKAAETVTGVAENIQLVPFHPDASYSDMDRDPADFATRSPYPMMHILRESDVTKAEESWATIGGRDIQSSNAERLRGMGFAAVQGVHREIRASPGP